MDDVYSHIRKPAIIYGDNGSAIKLETNGFHTRNRDVEIEHHFISERVH